MQITARRFTALSSWPRCRNGFFEVSNAALQSNNQWCWSSSSAAVSSDSSSRHQGRKKVPKQERSAMVLAFVKKYRALNGGKFPTPSCTQKQVGGSYYILREIIQELEHNHKRAPTETNKGINIREENANCEEDVGVTTELRKQHSSKKIKEGTKASRLSIDAHSDNQIEVDFCRRCTPSRANKESQQDKGPLIPVEEVENQVSAKLEAKTSIMHTFTKEREVCREDAASASNLHGETFRSEELYHDQRQMAEEEEGAASTNRSKFWGNLKSMAVGIFNLWKK